jgi:hypothetical protein
MRAAGKVKVVQSNHRYGSRLDIQYENQLKQLQGKNSDTFSNIPGCCNVVVVFVF